MNRQVYMYASYMEFIKVLHIYSCMPEHVCTHGSDAAFNKDLGGKKSFCATPTVKALALLLSFIFLLFTCSWLSIIQQVPPPPCPVAQLLVDENEEHPQKGWYPLYIHTSCIT